MPTDATLLKQQRNILLQIIVGAEFDPVDFEWQELVLPDYHSTSWMAGGPVQFRVSKLVHRSSGYYIIFGGLNVIYSPGTTRKEEAEEHHDNWEKRFSSFRAWLRCLRKELDAPDLWAMAAQDRDFMRLTSNIDPNNNTPFTETEQQYIGTKLDEMLDFILASAQLDDDAQRQLVEAQTEYMKEAMKRSRNRIDWKNILVGSLMGLLPGLVANAAFAPDKVRELFHIAAEAFTPLFQGVLGLNP